MKFYKFLIHTLFLCLLAVVSIAAQQTAEKKPYENVLIEKFTIRAGVEFPADQLDGLSKSVV